MYIDPEQPLYCGIELDQPRNIWGLSLPPEDWQDAADEFRQVRCPARLKTTVMLRCGD
jgi:hypothetical protein